MLGKFEVQILPWGLALLMRPLPPPNSLFTNHPPSDAILPQLTSVVTSRYFDSLLKNPHYSVTCNSRFDIEIRDFSEYETGLPTTRRRRSVKRGPNLMIVQLSHCDCIRALNVKLRYDAYVEEN